MGGGRKGAGFPFAIFLARVFFFVLVCTPPSPPPPHEKAFRYFLVFF